MVAAATEKAVVIFISQRLLKAVLMRHKITVILFLFLSFNGDSFAQQNLPAPLEKLFAKGVEALKSGDLETAEKTFSEALRQGGKHPLVYHNLGVISQQRGDHQRAVAHFRAAIRLQPDYGPSRLLIGANQQAARSDPKLPEIHLALALIYLELKRYDDAMEEIDLELKLVPESKTARETKKKIEAAKAAQ